MPLGFGRAPLGSSLAGYGSPDTESPQSGAPFTDELGEQQGSRYLDTRSRQWVFDDGRPRGMRNVQHLVMMRMLTIEGSSAWSGGIAPVGGVIGANIEQRLKDDVRNALNDLVQARIIEIVSILISVQAPRVDIKVQWRDLGTDESNSSELSL